MNTPESLLQDTRIKQNSITLYAILAYLIASHQTEYLPQPLILKTTGLTRHKLTEALTPLEMAGWVKIKRGETGGSFNRYILRDH